MGTPRGYPMELLSSSGSLLALFLAFPYGPPMATQPA